MHHIFHHQTSLLINITVQRTDNRPNITICIARYLVNRQMINGYDL